MCACILHVCIHTKAVTSSVIECEISGLVQVSDNLKMCSLVATIKGLVLLNLICVFARLHEVPLKPFSAHYTIITISFEISIHDFLAPRYYRVTLT